jgi:hypothetical protein
MSWDEVRTRLAQAFGKRFDVLAAKLGHNFVPAINPAFGPRTFFFASHELPERITLLKELLPDESERISKEAAAICQHRFQLLGYRDLDYGPEIDWHTDIVHGKRAPLKPWYQIQFLDFQEVGDHKITWELNRHQHLVTLAKAWCLTREARFVDELVQQWYSWQNANPYPYGMNWSSSLEVAFRSLSWLWIAALLDTCAPVPSDFGLHLRRSLMLNGRYIERYLSTYFSPNTHLLGEAVALFFIANWFAPCPTAERWKRKGWNLILEAASRQVRSDGVYFEQALHYHVYALDFFLHSRVLAGRAGLTIPPEFDAVIEKMLAFLEALSQTSSPIGFGDDDGGRLFNPRRNRPEHMSDPLSLGALLYGREHIRSAAPLTEEAIWLFGDNARLLSQPQRPGPIRSKAFEASGIYVLAGEAARREQMVVDAGPQGIGRCGHGHADALSVRLSVDGRCFLVDPGTGVYISDTNERDLFRGTAAHNTVRVDGCDQAVANGPFAWCAIPNVKAERWVGGDGFAFLSASHDGYSRLADPVLHRRFVFHGSNGVWMIRDVCEGGAIHQIESFWHFADDIEVREQGGAFLACATSASSPQDSDCLTIYTPTAGPWRAEIAVGSTSSVYGRKDPAPIVCLSANVQLPVSCATLLLVQKKDQPLGRFTEIKGPQCENAQGYLYETATEEHLFTFAQARGTWRLAEWTSDAEFLYSKSDLGRLTQIIMVAGSSLIRSGTSLVSNSCCMEQWSWSRPRNTFSSSEAALEQLKQSEIEA